MVTTPNHQSSLCLCCPLDLVENGRGWFCGFAGKIIIIKSVSGGGVDEVRRAVGMDVVNR
ncbi:hypothetical protein EPI10_024812 [Gossypium australe]|uniref:Uncharacterized protein n=1 Tax=Gossypium australe TaxID=47621 RepID=A0A5B6VZV4_9ROSI|nr:hypothetical protein EPI10_024812 [Gossypium australe]